MERPRSDKFNRGLETRREVLGAVTCAPQQQARRDWRAWTRYPDTWRSGCCG